MLVPFHLSFAVPDLDKVKTFYICKLGCRISEDHGQWVTIIFFGHQLTIHQESAANPARIIDHFGPVLSKKKWLEILDNSIANDINFEMKPLIKDSGQETESGKYIIKDPVGNLLEIKYYSNNDIWI